MKFSKAITTGVTVLICLVLIAFAGLNLSLIIQDKVFHEEASIMGYVPMIAGEDLSGTDFEKGDLIFGIKGERGTFADWKIAGAGAVYEGLRSPWFALGVGIVIAAALLIGDGKKKVFYSSKKLVTE